MQRYRFKTQKELIDEYGTDWSTNTRVGVTPNMQYILGQELTDIDAFLYADAQTTHPEGIFQLNSEYAGRPKGQLTQDEVAHLAPELRNWWVSPATVVALKENEYVIEGENT